MIKLISNVLFVISHFMYLRGFFKLYVPMWIVEAKTVETERKPFIYYMHLSLNLAPIFCLKGHIPAYIHC